MAVTIVSCYFLPFLFFFFAQIAFPKSILAFVLGIGALSVSCLILYVLMLDQKKLPENLVPEVYPPLKSEQPVAAPQTVIVAETKVVENKSKISYQQNSPILASAKSALTTRPKVQLTNHKALIEEQKNALISQQNLFTEELEKKTAALKELQTSLEHAVNALKAKDIETAKQAKELEDLKFELYTLLRIESYVTTKDTLAAASF